MLLLDTSVILEVLLQQENAAEAERLLMADPADRLHITDFALHSVGVILLKRGMHEVFLQAVEDILLTAGVRLLDLGAEDMQAVVANARKFTLSFDDAYQYTVAEKHGLTVVSFDSDFDRTERGRKRPGEVH